MGERVLLAGGTEKSRELLQTLTAPGSWECCKLCHSGGETRRALGEGEWSLLIINTPLGDESGLELAMEAAGRTMAAVLLLVKGGAGGRGGSPGGGKRRYGGAQAGTQAAV